MAYKSEGFPKQISDYIEIPPIEELLLMPFMSNIEIDKAYRNGTEFQRLLLDKTKFSNKKKNILVQMTVVCLTPSVSPVINDFELDKEWHVDGHDTVEPGDVIFHLLTNKTSSMTEFNAGKFVLEHINASNQLIRSANRDEEVRSLLIPQEIESNKIYTFDNSSLHRGRRSAKTEFRFMYRVIEQDTEDGIANGSFGLSSVFNKNREPLTSIYQEFSSGKLKNIHIFKY